VAKCQRPPQAVMPRQYTSNTWPVDHVTELGRAQAAADDIARHSAPPSAEKSNSLMHCCTAQM
jgi:hypothetical protein